MKENPKILPVRNTPGELPKIEHDDRNLVTNLLFKETESKTESAVQAKKKFETETRELLSGETITIAGVQEEFHRYIAEAEKNHEPRFALFLNRLGNLCKWTDEEKQRYSKPRIAAVTIIEVIYLRFPFGLLKYLQLNNKYVGYFVRRTKNYKLLNEDGILKLEQFLDDANTTMLDSKDYYDFRIKMHERFNVAYQTQAF